MKKFIIVLLGLTLFLTVPLQTVAAVTHQPQEIKESYQTKIEGKVHTFNSVTKGSTQTITIDNGEQVDTVSFDRAKKELRINNELVELEEFKEAGKELINEDGEISTKSNKDYQWRLVKNYKNKFNITVAIVALVTGAILALPTGTGAIAGAVLTLKAVAIIATAVTSASGSTGQKVFHYTFKTYYSPKNGYWNNKFVLSVYKDSKRKKLLKKVSHQTRLGKKY
ncbi:MULTISPECIES: hypothetical protein [Bacillus]|uniref:hypothetical protein n=1 Tax=Bacillus TaxID=1386 RepID=UPI000B448761|nr:MULTISPECIES: hypothetical protein [Bacillus]MCR6472541.1 hypothetical protein [Bacillus safensis]MCY7494001.1 hypothetical protein [Bacillus safensis]MED4992010.1 hypothetical protein [Bacillus safensis]QSJ00295.1 hypothetical protein JJ692_14465 [Bacillus sp. 3a]UDB47434.1 hypothetical protein B0X07_19055 [Bacillus safensis]